MSQPVQSLARDWKNLVATDKFEELFGELEQHLNSHSDAFNVMVNLKRRYNRLHKSKMEGTISQENEELEYNQISIALIDAIDDLQPSDLDGANAGLDELQHLETLKKPIAKEEHAWEFTADANTRSAYEKFLTRFPDGFYAANARERLDYFDADDTTWEFASESDSEKAMRKYLEKYPEGRHVTEARKKIAEVRRRIDPFYDLMVPVKGATFEMGDTFGDGGEDEKPVHQVTVSDFWLCKYPVTQGLWKAIMGENNNPSHFKGNDLLPVEMVSWDATQAFIEILNQKTGGQYRLPTEAEWEYAAREGGKEIRFGNGKDIANPAEMNFYAKADFKQPYSVVGEHREKTTPVNQFEPNALGLYDMAGNVYDWCADWYAEDYYQQGQAQGMALNPKGPDIGEHRVLRGGGWYTYPFGCRAARRDPYQSTDLFNDAGFRLASSLM